MSKYDVIQALQANGYAYAATGVRPPSKIIHVKSRVKAKENKVFAPQTKRDALTESINYKPMSEVFKPEIKLQNEITPGRFFINYEDFLNHPIIQDGGYKKLVKGMVEFFDDNYPLGMVEAYRYYITRDRIKDPFIKTLLKCVFMAIADDFNRADQADIEAVLKEPSIVLKYFNSPDRYGYYLILPSDSDYDIENEDGFNEFTIRPAYYSFEYDDFSYGMHRTYNIMTAKVDNSASFYNLPDLVRYLDDI